MSVEKVRRGAHVLGAFIDALTWDEALARISAWAAARESRYVCLSNAHAVVTTTQDKNFLRIVNEADMATPDGMPVAWMLRRLGFREQRRISGPNLMWRYLALAESRRDTVYFYGSSDATLILLSEKLRAAFPGLGIAGAYSPPFRPLTEEEDAEIVARINGSGAGAVFVSLGCPKQEKWMAAHRGRIRAVMCGVGAAFEFHAGVINRAPVWMQNCGLEWLYRLCSEPRRLWKRYLITNTLFVAGAVRQLLSSRSRER
jgi:N-acetylglucosaminyldiphosphoundecaprenol N-acetyl-beta-D-mannosaminyltransferase